MAFRAANNFSSLPAVLQGWQRGLVLVSDSAERTKMAGKEPANVVSSAMARQKLARIKGVAHALAKPVVIVKRCIGLETRT